MLGALSVRKGWQLKQVKYMDLVANAVMLHNIVDLTDVLANMVEEGLPVTQELVARTDPILPEHLRRFGQYDVDMEDLPAPLQPRSLPILGSTPSCGSDSRRRRSST